MSFQWQFVACVLYVEIALVLILCLRFIRSSWWASFFRSSLAKAATEYGNTVFWILASVLGLFFFDAFRDVRKYDLEEKALKTATHNPDALNQLLMFKFRSQRNLYISGFSLFLWFVMVRLSDLLKEKAQAKADAAAATAQAKSAARTAELLLDQNKEIEEKGKEDVEDDLKNELKELKAKYEKAQKDRSESEAKLCKAEADLIAMKKQSESLSKEYDRMTAEFAQMQNEKSDKKDE